MALGYARKYRQKQKFAVLEHYGLKCAICDFDDYRALQIDHIENNGAEHRKSLGGQHVAGWNFYRWLVVNDFPTGFQTLCANCNNIKQWNKNNGLGDGR